MLLKICKIAILFALALFSTNAEAGIVNASLVNEYLSLKPHYTYKTRVIFKLEIENGWHIYWANPGDAGEETTVKLKSFSEKHLKKTIYSLPEKVTVHEFTEFGLKDQAFLMVELDIPSPKKIKTLPLSFSIEWLACKDNCVPGNTEISIDIPVTGNENIKNNIFDNYLKYFPSEKKLNGKYYIDDTVAMFIPKFKFGSEIYKVELFPYKGEMLDNKSDVMFEATESGLLLQTDKGEVINKKPLKALLKINDNKGYNVIFKRSKTPIDKMSFPYKKLCLMVLSALLGGLILNLMPCVLPVLSLKAFQIINQKNDEHKKNIQNALSYTGGILLTFITLGGILSYLNYKGNNALWGFQMQNPTFIVVMAYIFLILGLMMSDLFSLNICFSGNSSKSSFISGILTVLIASPCTAPFMGVAIAWAIMTKSAVTVIAVFLSLGLGMALPWILIALFPSVCKKLPKPGEWMNHFKHTLAFLIYATVIWLLWILLSIISSDIVTIIMLSMLLIIFMTQIKNVSTSWVKYLFAIITILSVIWCISMTMPENDKPNNIIEKYSAEKLEYYKNKNIPVLLKFSAKWCLTCMVNEKLIFSDKNILETFRKNGIIIMNADWTNRNKDISDIIKSYGKSGVPLYVYFDGEKDTILPPLVTKEQILRLVEE